MGLTQDDVTAAGGPSDTTQTRVENAEGPPPNLTTRNKLDRPLRWQPGSAARVWAGGEPVPLDTLPPAPGVPTTPAVSTNPAVPTNLASPAVAGPNEVPMSVRQLTSLLEIYTRLATQNRAEPELLADLKELVSALVGRWVTEVLEHSTGPRMDVPTLLRFAFGRHLEEPVDVADTGDRDGLYRRWLMWGAEATGITPEQRAMFENRYQAREDERRHESAGQEPGSDEPGSHEPGSHEPGLDEPGGAG